MPRIITAPIPATRDPFINTPLIRLTPDKKTGAERFWISTWNSNQGSTAALVDEQGASRIYRFKPPHSGFYSAVQADDDTLWLCGSLDRVVRFTLSSGKVESFPTGSLGGLVFQGMVLDKPTGKLLASSFMHSDMATHAFVFDTRNLKPVANVKLPTKGHYPCFSFPNGDGTHSLLHHLPGDHVVRWDPRTDSFSETLTTPEIDIHSTESTTYTLAADERGRRYFPGKGWFNPATRAIEKDGPKPRREMTWIDRHGDEYIGCNWSPGEIKVGAWNIHTGDVRSICTIADAAAHSFNITRSGKVVSVNIYGVFEKFDIATGAMECSRVLDADAIGSVDCMTRLDKHTVLGTPFITQRFWTLNLKTKKGQDAGRAAPGAGEIMRLCRANAGKVYMAAYTGAELTEFDPAKPARFPENPRVVTAAPGGMRPVAIATDGRIVWYACSKHYGNLGSVITRYDTKTGNAQHAVNPLGDFQVQSLFYEKKTRTLIAGSTIHADCASATPTQKTGIVARFNADTLDVLARRPAPGGSPDANVLGPISATTWLAIATIDGQRATYILSSDLASTRPDPSHAILPGHRIIYAGTPGKFAIVLHGRFELWDYRKAQPKLERVLAEGKWPIHLVSVEEGSILFTTPKEVVILDGVLKK